MHLNTGNMITGAMGDIRSGDHDVREELVSRLALDVDWRHGRLQGLNHFGGDDVLSIALEAYVAFASTNPVSRRAFPSVGQLEDDILQSAKMLMGGTRDECGTITSGGTESIFLASLAARNRFRERAVDGVPQVILPSTAHPAFNKAADLLGLEVIRIAVGDDLRADPAAMERAIGPRTMMIVGSAPCYPYGLFDPIEDLAALAGKHGIWMHVDACIGGFQAPFARVLGYEVPAFGFDLPGVSSISADLHKYGFTLKGASVVLFANAHLRASTLFRFEDWPRGLYATDSFSGTRSGGPIAAAWAVMRYLGFEGYADINRRIFKARDHLISRLASCGCELVGEPELTLIAIRPTEAKVGVLAEDMAKRGWILNVLLEPEAIQIMLNMSHVEHMDELISDLGQSARSAAGKVTNEKLTAEY